MPSPLTCPKCHAEIPKGGIVPGQSVVCGKCGATLNVKPRSATAAPQAPSPAATRGPIDVAVAPSSVVPLGDDEGYGLAPEAVEQAPSASRRPSSGAASDAPRPEPSGAKRIPTTSRESRPSLERPDRRLLVIGGAVGLVALVGVVVAAMRWSGGTPEAPAEGQAQAKGDPAGVPAQPPAIARSYAFEAATSSAVTKDPGAILPGALYAFRASPPPFGPIVPVAANWPRWSRQNVTHQAGASEGGGGVPTPLGSPAESVSFAPGLLIPVGRAVVPLYAKAGPVFSLDRRYAVVSSFLGAIPEHRWFDDPKVPGRRVLVPADPKKAMPPLVLVDLSTGKPAGEFPSSMPQCFQSRLSPDGKYAVTPAWEEIPDLSKSRSFVLDIWRKGEKKVDGQIAPTGCVRWAEFVSPTRLALFQQEPDPALVVWDVATRKVSSRIPTTIDRPPSAQPSADWAAYIPNASGGAVAPGGRFVAIGGPTSVIVFDLEAGKEHGRFPIRGNDGIASYSHLAFLTRPDRLVAVAAQNVSAWDLTTGALSHAGPFPGQPQFRGSFENGGDGRLDLVVRRFTAMGPEAVPAALSKAGGLFLAPPQERSGTAPDVLKKIPSDWVELQVLYTHEVDDELVSRDAVVAYEPFASVAARPAVAPGDRKGVKAKPPEPATEWETPSASEWARPKPGGRLPLWPAAIAGDHAAVIRYEPVEQKVRSGGRKQRFFAMFWDRYDLATGKPAGAPIALWPWANDPNLLSDDPSAAIPTPPASTTAALTPDGKRLALVDPNEPHRVDMWDGTGARTGFLAAADGAVVEWLGWSADGLLLSLAAGSLTAWDARTAKAVWETEGAYRPPVALARSNRWLALHAGSYVDLIDSATGRCLGRCRTSDDIASPVAFSLSPDARRLFVMAKKPQATQSSGGIYEFYSGTMWDLTKGAAESFAFGTRMANQFNELHNAGWTDPEHFAVFMTGLSIYDLRAKGMVAEFNVSVPTSAFAPDRPWYRTSPDGRIWLHAHADATAAGPLAWLPVPFPEQTETLFDPGRSYHEVARQPLRVEVDFQDAARSKRAARAIADVMAGRGYTIGDGGWILRVTSDRSAESTSLTRGGLGGDLKINNIRLDWSLIPPSSNAPTWTWQQDRTPLTGSRYVKGHRADASAPTKVYTVVEYDFEGKDPMTVLTEEYLDKASRAPEVPGNLTGWALVAKGRAYALPLSGTCEVPR